MFGRYIHITSYISDMYVCVGFKVVVEKDAGVLSQFPDEDYEAVGAAIVPRKQAWKADIVVCSFYSSLSSVFICMYVCRPRCSLRTTRR